MIEIDLENADGRPACWRHVSVSRRANEMPCPLVAAWIEQRDDFTGLVIDPGDIRAVVAVARKTT